MITAPQPHWHEQNPWKDKLIYVPVPDLAACALRLEDPHNSWTMVDMIAHWIQYGNKLDAYILNAGVVLTGGVRHGPEPWQYLSPGFSLPKLIALRDRFTSSPSSSSSSSISSP